MKETTHSNEVAFLQLCDPSGVLDEDHLDVSLTADLLEALYRRMKFSRAFDRRAVQLQRQGRLGTYAPARGQEGCQVGCSLALESDDYVFPSYREAPLQLSMGVSPESILTYWGGDESGSQYAEDVPVFPVSVPVGSHALHAVGAARARRLQDDPILCVACFGDGATSEGDLLAAMNFAGVLEVPVLFFCQNNQWAISTPREQQTASETLAQKADAFGFDGVQIDGNDPIAAYQVVRRVRERCLESSTPFFVEALTYRLGPHTTSDDPNRYRPESETDTWRKRDPIVRLRRLLERREDWDEDRETRLENEIEDRVESAVTAYENRETPDPHDIFRYTYASLTPPLKEQQKTLEEEIEGGE